MVLKTDQSFHTQIKKDPRCRYYIDPVRVVWCDPGEGELLYVENLLKNDLSKCTIRTSEKVAPAIVLDFDREFNGGIEIDLSNSWPLPFAEIRIRFGESISEVMKNPNNDHSMHDVILNMSVMGKHEFGNTGFRFVRLDFLSCDVPINITSVKLIALELPCEYLGRFESSDDLLNDIWKVGARTV